MPMHCAACSSEPPARSVCPGGVIIRTLDAIRDIRDAALVVARGFHSPMERECLHFLLRGAPEVILRPAHGLESATLGTEEQRAFDDRRLIVASIFGCDVSAPTPSSACRRTDFVASVSPAVLVPDGVCGGKAESPAWRALRRGQLVVTLADDENLHLVADGAIPIDHAYLEHSSAPS